jgi:hypothetical protein
LFFVPSLCEFLKQGNFRIGATRTCKAARASETKEASGTNGMNGMNEASGAHGAKRVYGRANKAIGTSKANCNSPKNELYKQLVKICTCWLNLQICNFYFNCRCCVFYWILVGLLRSSFASCLLLSRDKCTGFGGVGVGFTCVDGAELKRERCSLGAELERTWYGLGAEKGEGNKCRKCRESCLVLK